MNEVKQPPKPAENRLDRFISYVAPMWGAKRRAARLLREHVEQKFSSWDGGKQDRFKGNNWIGSRLSTDSALEESLEDMRQHSRELYKTDSTVAAFVDSRVYNTVHCGIRPQSRISAMKGLITQAQADEWSGQLEDIFRRWAPLADFHGLLSFWELQRQVERNWTIDGEVFVRFAARAGVDKPIPLALEIIPADRVATPDKFIGDQNVRLGIRYDGDGWRVGYYVLKFAPGDTKNFSQDFKYYEASYSNGLPQIVHLFDQLFPGQSRGVPPVEVCKTRIKDIKDLAEAIVIREQVKACFSVFVTTAADPIAEATGKATDTSANGYRIQDVSPGRVDYLAQGQDVKFADPGQGGSEYGPFLEWLMLQIAAALNWPYSWLTKDYRRSTYSSERMAAIDGGMAVRTRQQAYDSRLLYWVWQWVVVQAVSVTDEVGFSPDFHKAHRDLLHRHEWLTPKRPWVDPLKDVQAHKLAVDNNFTTRSAIISENNGDPEEVMATRSKEKEWDRQWGITPVDQQGPAGTDPVEPERPQPQEDEVAVAA